MERTIAIPEAENPYPSIFVGFEFDDDIQVCIEDVFMQGRSYKDLIAWQKAHRLCLFTYARTGKFPSVERFRLINQMCRSASSVPTNLAEGNAARSPKEKRRYFGISLASLDELHYQYLLAKDLQYITEEEFISLDKEINNVSYFITKLRSSFAE